MLTVESLEAALCIWLTELFLESMESCSPDSLPLSAGVKTAAGRVGEAHCQVAGVVER